MGALVRLRRPGNIFPLALLLATLSLAGAEPAYKRTVETYAVPDAVLTDQSGARVSLKQLLASDQVVVLDFIFGTCTTICPVLSAGYANLQQRLGPRSADIRLVSITIDPEHDTPPVMRAYLKRYRARPGWTFLTGKREDIDRVMNAFNAYIPNKMSHYPLTLIRTSHGGTWIRIFGLMSTSEFLEECRKAGIQ